MEIQHAPIEPLNFVMRRIKPATPFSSIYSSCGWTSILHSQQVRANCWIRTIELVADKGCTCLNIDATQLIMMDGWALKEIDRNLQLPGYLRGYTHALQLQQCPSSAEQGCFADCFRSLPKQ
eukprot:scaffold309236_cov18-Tisochrysis_lutea.AAC.1